eukprot:364743-Chlamydomonas_euryale.AAC.43
MHKLRHATHGNMYVQNGKHTFMRRHTWLHMMDNTGCNMSKACSKCSLVCVGPQAWLRFSQHSPETPRGNPPTGNRDFVQTSTQQACRDGNKSQSSLPAVHHMHVEAAHA